MPTGPGTNFTGQNAVPSPAGSRPHLRALALSFSHTKPFPTYSAPFRAPRSSPCCFSSLRRPFLLSPSIHLAGFGSCLWPGRGVEPPANPPSLLHKPVTVAFSVLSGNSWFIRLFHCPIVILSCQQGDFLPPSWCSVMACVCMCVVETSIKIILDLHAVIRDNRSLVSVTPFSPMVTFCKTIV